MTDLVPEMVAAQVRFRHELGASCEDVSLWLAQIGYSIQPDEVVTIASQHAQQVDTDQARMRAGSWISLEPAGEVPRWPRTTG